jgi:hypothetical protein
MAIETIDNFGIFVGKNIDSRYGPYADVAEATGSINSSFRYKGLTVLLTGSGQNLEYWFNPTVADEDLVPKGAAISLSGTNGQVVFYSGSNALSGSPSFIFNYTSSTPTFNVSGAISASYGPNTVGFYGTASWALNATSASYAARGGDVTRIIAGTNVTVSPPEGTGSVTINSSAAAGSGVSVAATASFTNATTWTFNHNLQSRYVIIQALDNNHNQIIPENITLVNTSSAVLTFPTPESGYAMATIGGTTASVALTAISVLTNNGGKIYDLGNDLVIEPFNNLIISGNMIPGPPYTNNKSSFNLGSPTTLWNHLYAGSITLTGSLNITGSTTQIGNNTLVGNTLLTGSITISGSNPPGSLSASVQIYGDIRQSGYHRFDPVTTNIDTSISASYIYVSGSTQDLYFSQNGNGYNNVTRLRWLESVLYTGVLKGGVLSSIPGTTTFQITGGDGIIVAMNASTTQDPYPTIKFVSWLPQTLPIINSGSAKITYVGIDNTGTVTQQTVPWGSSNIDQWDNSISLGVVLHLSGSVSTGVFNAPQIAYGQQQKSDDFFRAFGPLKVSGHTLLASGSTLGIKKTGGTSYREGANYAINPNHPSTVVENAISTSKIYRYYISGSTPVIDTGIANAGYTVIDPTKYVNTTTGQLTTVTGNNSNQWYWTIQRVFWVPNSPTNAFIVYYGNAEYPTLIDAKNGIDTETFSEAPNTAQNSILIGYILVRKGCTDLSDTTGVNAVLVQGGLFRNVGGNGGSGTSAATSLGSLSDVTITSPTYGDLLMYDTTVWNNTKTLSGSYSISGSLTIGSITNTPSTEATLNIYPPITPGIGEGGQIMLAASGGLYSSASMLDTYQNYFRILRGTNTGGSNAQLVGLDLHTGNLSVAGAVNPSSWTAGQVIKDTILSNTEVTVSTTTIATSTSDTDFVTYNYTPVSSNSYLVIHYHLASYDFSGGTGNDSYISRIKVDSSEITYSKQSTVNGNRSGVLFPLTGRYTNSNTAAKSIVVACRRDGAGTDDSITIVNSSTSMWLRITEIAR